MQFRSRFMGCPRIRTKSRRRRATTLIELAVVTALVSILLMVVGTLAVHLRQWDRKVREHGQHSYQLANLAEMIRADVRQATSITAPEKKIVVIAGPDSREIRYELQPEGCRRVVKTPGKTSPRIESFAIGPVDSWKVDAAVSGRRPAYTISLERSESDKVTSQLAPFFVYAALGSDAP